MRSLLLFIFTMFLLIGCASNPKTISTNYANDPKYTSKDCKEMRKKALDYDDKILARGAAGFGLGFFLGPLGIPLAAAGDYAQNEERKAWSREVHLACSSEPLPNNLK